MGANSEFSFGERERVEGGSPKDPSDLGILFIFYVLTHAYA